MCTSRSAWRVIVASAVVSFAPAWVQTARPQGPVHFLDILASHSMLTPADHERLARGDSVARVLDAAPGQLAVLAMVDTRATADSLLSSVRDIATLKRSAYVRTIRRFSSPPVLSDLDELRVSPEDRQDIADCTPADCAIKLTPDELMTLAAPRGAPGPDHLDSAFRAVVLARAQRYLRDGALVAQAHRERPGLASPFDRILGASPYVTDAFPRLAAHLRQFPHDGDRDLESFLYWSVESFGRKPVVVVTHVAILHPAEEERARGVSVLIAGKQVFATHYMDASLSLTALVDYQGRRYLTYVNRSETDALGGVFGWLKRTVVERRIRTEAASILAGVRRRVEARPHPE